jgi:hypothetical protein
VFSSALFALVLALSADDVSAIAARFSPRTPTRWICGFLAFLALGLGGMWVYYSLRFALTDELPAGSALVETNALVHLDLSILVPAYALAALLLWRRAAWGYVLSAVVLISGAVHQVGYMVALPFQVNAGVPGATAFDPAEPLIAVAFWSLLWCCTPMCSVLTQAGTSPSPPARSQGGRGICSRGAEMRLPAPIVGYLGGRMEQRVWVGSEAPLGRERCS